MKLPSFGIPKFSSAAVCKVAGIDPPILRTWRARNLLEPIPEDAHRGHSKYSLADLLHVVALARLTQLGITPRRGSFLVNELATAIMVVAQRGENESCYFIAQPQSDVFMTTTSYDPGSILGGSGIGLVLDLTKVWNDLESKLEELGEE